MDDNFHRAALIPHVFLPLQLPGKISETLIAEESHLLSLFLQTIREYKSIPQINETCSVFKTWVKVQHIDCGIATLRDAIQTLQPGQLFALYVRAQNCGLLISIPKKHSPTDIIWSTFPASQRSASVTGSAGDLEVSFPTTSVTVQRPDVLHSEAFAKQLKVLISSEFEEAFPTSQKAGISVQEIRDVCDTRFISGWLSALLVAPKSTQSFGDIPQITKKIRDSVVYDNALLPFRRSGMWTAASVVLQISLVRDLGDVVGRFLYKIIILRLMLKFLVAPVFPVKSTGIEMLKKIGRRIRKLEEFKNEIPNMNDDFAAAYDSLVKDAKRVIKSARGAIDKRWKNIIDSAKDDSIVVLKGAQFNMTQSLSGNGLLTYLSSSSSVKVEKTEVSLPHVPLRHLISLRDKYSHNIPQWGLASICPDPSITLFDFERNVWQNWSAAMTVTDAEYVWRKFDQYLSAAMSYYRNDPVGMSRAIITALKMIEVWDRCVCNRYPMLRRYKLGINPSFIRMLLVTTKWELEIVNALEAYFQSRELAPNSCLLEERPTRDSFAVRFAEQSLDMESVRKLILEEGRQRAEAKINEVERAREYCKSLRTTINRSSHTYAKDQCGDMVHTTWCSLCALKEEEADYRVHVYEKPLPEGLHDQRAVLFELLIPSDIACLRDLLYKFAENFFTSVGDQFSAHIRGVVWCEDSQLSPHSKRSLNWYINLGSTTKHFVDCHYSSLHPSRRNIDFVVNNGYNLHYAGGSTTIRFSDNAGSNIKDWCTLKVEPHSQYASMQWAIDGNNQTPNEVLARQSECHRNMSTSEFVEFGSLRCYNTLQIRNLINAAVLGTLSFKNESVFNLICQSLWECSPFAKYGVRAAHEDFSNAIFLQECLAIMDNLRAKHRDNWQDHYVVLTVVVFAVNVAERSDDPSILDSAGTLILACRDLTAIWSADIQSIISTMTSTDTEQKNKLTLKLVEVNICRAISFGAHKRLRTIRTSEHIKNWLQAIVIVYDHLAFVSENASNQVALLMRRVIELGVDVEEYLKGTPVLHRGLNLFLRSHYGGADDLDFSTDTQWTFYENAPQVCYLEVSKKKRTDESVTLQLDIVTGNFLVNGCTMSRLPAAIENHADYRRVFPTMSFEVQPLGPNEFVTKHAYDGSYYAFTLNGDTLIVEEIITGSGVPNRRTLIPSIYLPANFPHKFEREFTHWWNEQTQVVEFFPRHHKKPLKIMGKECELLLDVRNGRKLQHLESRRFLADIRCSTFQRIAKVFNRLESTVHIHVWREIDGTYTLELPRMRLSFVVTGLGIENSISITSQEYEGMHVAKQQQLETLVGLEQGLLLTNDEEKMLLVPHGIVNLNGHHCISISTSDLLDPPYFRYDVDERLLQLKAGETQTGWFYLAYLHAITSSCVPDPLTGVTGTERAFELLNSGLCFPSQPFCQATERIIFLLRDLAPIRSYYPKHLRVMETTKWPSFIPPLAAHDNYVDVMDNLTTKSNRLVFLFDWAAAMALHAGNADLRSKAAWRRAIISNGMHGIEPFPNRPHRPSTEDFAYCTDGVNQSIQVSELCHLIPAELPNIDVFAQLRSLLLNKKKLLAGFDNQDLCSRNVSDWMSVDFTNSWLGLYEAARGVKRSGQKYDWICLLSCLAFRRDDKISLDQLSILNAVAGHSEKFDAINPPPYGKYSDTSQHEYDGSEIEGVLLNCRTTTLGDYVKSHIKSKHKEETKNEFLKRMKLSYKKECQADLTALTTGIRNHWPCAKIRHLIAHRPVTEFYNWSVAHGTINNLFTKWFKNRALRAFVEQVSTTLTNICALFAVNTNLAELVSVMSPIKNSNVEVLSSSAPMLVQLKDFVSNNFQQSYLDYCGQVFRGSSSNASASAEVARPGRLTNSFPFQKSTDSQIYNEFIKGLRSSWDQWQWQKNVAEEILIQPPYTCSVDIWNHICEAIKQESEIYFLSDWCPRITPTTLLPLILCKTIENGTALSNLRELLGGYAVTITKEQHKCRIERFRRRGNDLDLLEMQRESGNIGHTNWSPEMCPEWLLLEIENDFLVRPSQIEVAQRMEYPDDGKNSLMQLNMGEGKTAVIIPLLALSLADGSRLCRITVLRSLYQINLKSLSLKIGGLLLNRRVYTMPCRRDYKIAGENVGTIMNAYRECLDAKGVLLTLSEHRLSLQLKKHEKALAKCDSDSTAINDVLEWLRRNARDVLDESDEILQVKYQLLYTLGVPLTINGGPLRWTITQKILGLVPNQMKRLLRNKRLANQLELKVASSGQEFPHCRVLSEKAYQTLCAGLSEDAIAIGLIPEPQPAIKNIVLRYLTQEVLCGDEMQTVYESFSLPSHKDTLLILRGLLACGVLRSCLSKRWRVNYGVNPTGHFRMAVPFRAKDVAADRAEFGHPDVAIVLTLLSYYYSGLSDDQLDDTFTRLVKLNFAEEEYQSWIALLPPETPDFISISKLSGINLRDYRQKYNVVFPAFRRNMATIEFWLGQAVFPVESKQFCWKIGCSAWDLCKDNTTHPTTGFSGTNDTKLLLPRTIQQSDLPILLGTNGKVLENLLRPENDHYEGLESHISAATVIKKMVEGNIKVLLDVGAVMLELSNEKVADEWMKQCVAIDAVVFFDDKNHLLVKTRLASRPVQFETSPFRNRLDRCAIYLDEIHTRGTDLKIPLGTIAVVTLGKGVRKDTLAQGCMRMRKLGQGHSIRFWGSNEVHPQILKFAAPERPGSYAVLSWAIQNSVQFMEEGFIHWAGSGTYELQKRTAEKICDVGELKLLAQLCSQKEVVELMSMYGLEKSLLTYPNIARNMIEKTIEHLRSNLMSSSHNMCRNEILGDSQFMLEHLNSYVGQSKRTTNILDEEQERELEHEIEEETEVERPPPSSAYSHVLNERLRKFVQTGISGWLHTSDLLPLNRVFVNSGIWKFCENATSWGHGPDFTLRATIDFERTVVQNFKQKSDDFLRPVQWIYNTVIGGVNLAIIMSPFEVNGFWNEFKAGRGTLLMYGPRLFRDQETLHESGPLMVPSEIGTRCILPSAMTASLDILAGSFNLRDESSERIYCCVLGISPKPRPPEEEEVFQAGGIVNGFIDPIHRNCLPMFEGVSAFQEHPDGLIRGITEARHGVFSEKTHIGNLIIFGRKNFTGESQ